ncbi:hypothetical protein Bbelb_095690 [Branchiostoma belcheri]|nr:hypothetical protein Bbelb_095690 [Branchiostoma belcheri]
MKGDRGAHGQTCCLPTNRLQDWTSPPPGWQPETGRPGGPYAEALRPLEGHAELSECGQKSEDCLHGEDTSFITGTLQTWAGPTHGSPPGLEYCLVGLMHYTTTATERTKTGTSLDTMSHMGHCPVPWKIRRRHKTATGATSSCSDVTR